MTDCKIRLDTYLSPCFRDGASILLNLVKLTSLAPNSRHLQQKDTIHSSRVNEFILKWLRELKLSRLMRIKNSQCANGAMSL